MVGLTNKEKDFWEEIKKWNIVLMSETWMDEKVWDKCRECVPRGYRWELQAAKKKSRKERARNAGRSETRN